MDKICELVWIEAGTDIVDPDTGEITILPERKLLQRERDCTPDEQAEIDARRAQAPMMASLDRASAIKTELYALDAKRVRPLAEGDAVYLTALNAQALSLRAELRQILEDTAGFVPI